jgi:diguanylate cyclase (GGDEF)-like protein
VAPPHPDSPDAVRELLERIAGSASVMLYRAEYGPDGSYTCTQFGGAPLESLIGPIPPDLTPEEAWDACIHPDDRDAYHAAWGDGMCDETVEFEYRMCGFDGVLRWMFERSRPAGVIDGRHVHDGIVVDVTDRRLATEALAATTAKLEGVLGSIDDFLFTLEPVEPGVLRLDFAGPNADRLLGGSPPRERLVECWREQVHPEDRHLYEAYVRRLAAREAAEVEYRLMGLDGHTRWVWGRARPRALPDGRVLIDGVATDVTERRALADRLAHLAYHDPLTGLVNRSMFRRHLDAAVARAERRDGAVAVLFVDLDNFKLVNDGFGHSAGDALLAAVARRLEAAVRPGDIVARQGGDEFLVLVDDVPAADRAGAARVAEAVADRIRAELRKPLAVSGTEVYPSASVGASLYPHDGRDSEALLVTADVAMYAAKDAGRDRCRLYVADAVDARAQLSTAARLHRAVEEGQFVLYYQPLVELATGAAVGAEALVRWRDPECGLVPPGEFLPLAERSGLLGAISDWVVAEACRQGAAWRAAGLDLYVSVNLSPECCRREHVESLLEAIERSGLPEDRFMVEVTETGLMVDGGGVEPMLAELDRRGIRIAIDDFGTGHSSLSRLAQMPVGVLKIDRSFVRTLTDDPRAEAIVRSIVQLARNLGLEPLAEGIETEEQKRALLRLGCTHGQGYLYGAPVPARTFTRLQQRRAA